LLRSYFEPTDEEREQGVKLPTKAHDAIADLIINGYVKVVITTNFDRLLEHALQQRGLQPTVISTPDGASGAIPLAHSDCTILKVNGDYLDERIKNAPNELSNYARPIASLLKRIFDEYGLIVCGWSADWDHALRAAIERHSGRRFSIYWTVRSNKSDIAKKTIKLISAEQINISDANSFFNDINENVKSLNYFQKAHPLSTKVAINSLKRYMQNSQTIRLHDLVTNVTDSLVDELLKEKYSYNGTINGDLIVNRMQAYENDAEIMLNLVAHGLYWGGETSTPIFTSAIQRVANAKESSNGLTVFIRLRHYPAMLLFYTAGIAAIGANNYKNLHSIFEKIIVRKDYKEKPPYLLLHHHNILSADHQKVLAGGESQPTPLSNCINSFLANIFQPIIPDQYEFDKYFDLMEYFIALCYLDYNLHSEPEQQRTWVPLGRFGWRNVGYSRWTAHNFITSQLNKYGNNFTPLTAGFFGADAERMKKTVDMVEEFANRVRSQSGWF